MKKDELTTLCSEYGVPSIASMLLMVGKTFRYQNDVYSIRSLVFGTSNDYPIASYVVERQGSEGTEMWIPEDVFKYIEENEIKSSNNIILETVCAVIACIIIIMFVACMGYLIIRLLIIVIYYMFKLNLPFDYLH